MWYAPDLVRTIRLDEFDFPHQFKTNGELVDWSNSVFRPNPSLAVEVYMLFDVAQCIATFSFIAYVLFKKGRRVRLFMLRKSPYGTFIVPNAICVLLAGAAVYLLQWAAFCVYIVWVQKSNHPYFEWLWFIPFPWLPLALIAFYSAYGFVISCSPRSPISNLRGSSLETKKLSKVFLPLPHSATVMNTFIIGVGVVMVLFNVVVQSLAGAQRNATHRPGHNVYKDVLTKQHTQEWLSQPPTQELLDLIRRGSVDGLNVYRYCCLALSSYAAIIVLTIAMLGLYSIPNQIFLIRHLCSIFPDPIPQDCQGDGLMADLRLLRRIGLPRNLKGDHYAAFKKTWMMTMVGHSQALLLLGGVFVFAVPPFFLLTQPWQTMFEGLSSDREIMFIVAYVITAALITATWVTSLSATLTFDEIFRAVSGLGNEQQEAAGSGQSASLPQHGRHIDRRFSGANIVPCSPTSPADLQSPNSVKSPGSLRPQLSFAPSSAESEKTDGSFDDLPHESRDNTVIVVTETVVRVEHEDTATMPEAADSIEMQTHRHTRSLSPSPVSAQYSFLSRNANCNS
ncbi:related to membrane protein Dik6 [Ustilago trichophora]|uniref:Related to membrane protein Dik6 n=1 Tax=Ustilago trichophora TaxID=86804 RepID=A0A5C3EAD5_9BASI|nr:related to membrane protein Dik6 [Ustilago trichophora]